MGKALKISVKTPEVRRKNSFRQTRKTAFSQSMSSPIGQILFLQRTLGNQAVQKFLKSGAIQVKLTMGQPGDIYEQEADRVTERVMRMPSLSKARSKAISKQYRSPAIQRVGSKCDRELSRPIQNWEPGVVRPGYSSKEGLHRQATEKEEGNPRMNEVAVFRKEFQEIEEQLTKRFTDRKDKRQAKRLAERKKRLVREFRILNPSEAKTLLERLINPQAGDIIPGRFQRLSRQLRNELLQLLFGKLGHVEAEILYAGLAKEPENIAEKKLHARFKKLVPGSKNRKELLGMLSGQFSQSHQLPSGKRIWIKLSGENFNIGSVSPDHDCKVCKDRGVANLGVDRSAGNNWMELRGDIAGHGPDVQYDFKRTVEVGTWKKVGRRWKKVRYKKADTDDDTLGNSDEDLTPKNNHIYVIDGPGPSIETPIWPGDERATGYVYMANFVEWVNVKVGSGSWTRASDYFQWHSITTLEKVNGKWRRKKDGLNEIAPGFIPVTEPLP